MRRMILAGIFLLSMIPLSGEEIIIEEEVKTDLKLEKAEAELEYMNEKVDFYKRVVRSVQREEEELKALKRARVRK
ncbi:hypothetical protein [Sebaldella sp. S0638]|uniref:hypothetical protein n=1 Tax=Sebaldella sp. S0638 TaxID=2957809 RepID=UPI00209F38F9|nr:hypothetical protein [Sebaldella sp. S0638]MCP1225028.1 hypothetical protein [Sebaldella sp. S0638]